MDAMGPLISLFTMLVFGAISLALMALWIVALLDCSRKEFPGENMKVIWVLIIVLAGWVGALAYWFAGRQTGYPAGTGPGAGRM